MTESCHGGATAVSWWDHAASRRSPGQSGQRAEAGQYGFKLVSACELPSFVAAAGGASVMHNIYIPVTLYNAAK